MSDYVYDPSKMEALFAELTDDDGDYGLSLHWETKRVKVEGESFKWEEIEDPTHDSFEYDGIRFSWYHAGNKTHPDTPVVIASWSVQKREDDFDDHEEEIDADAESIHSLIGSVNTGHYYE